MPALRIRTSQTQRDQLTDAERQDMAWPTSMAAGKDIWSKEGSC
jgi:hypothetical protein